MKKVIKIGGKKSYQLEKELLRNPVEETDILNNGVKQVMCNAGTNGLRQAIHRLLLLQPFRLELETYMRQELVFNPRGQLIPLCKLRSSTDRVSLQANEVQL